ncbi:hypothetical protein [Zavarzinia compransoris]|uniref:hypothetical protein n=1 Tax=Zavarzinia compransoris TaxID=1264899 RepID=UPI0010E6A2D2|nr:hypothetical protein [Zavarzinia compransoris]TDP46074.1 hypothetical protein DES42_104155 [Zavarzinia compransoris]
MFVFKSRRPFEAPVTVDVPKADGSFDSHTFIGKFIVLPDDERRSLSENAGGGDKGAKAVLDASLIGWGADLTDESGHPLPFSPENKAALLGDTAIFLALNVALATGLIGKDAVRAKN